MSRQRTRQAARAAARTLTLIAAAALILALGTAALAAQPGLAAASVTGVISNLTAWLVGIIAGLATLLFTIGGVRYLLAGGDPGEVRAAKDTLKYAAIGYAVAALAPVLVTLLQKLIS